jgi:membrane protease YdiL (CAAX protease family)
MTETARRQLLAGRKQPEIIFGIWCLLALMALPAVASLLKGSFPIFTALWILVPLVVVARGSDASRVGFRPVPWHDLVRVTAVNVGGLFLVALLIEPWSHTYQMLLDAALSAERPDTTFGWLIRFERAPALVAMFLYSGLVTLFGEELFFRGWLLHLLRRRWGTRWAVVGQALFFTVPNLLVAFVLPPLQGVLYVVVYTFAAVGLIGGWAAARTNSIWPSVISATVSNAVFVALLV